MQIDINKVALLARLKLTAEEQQRLGQNLGAILDYVKNLDKLDTQNVEPTSHVLNLENIYREDEIKKSGAREKVLKHAPSADGYLFKVPKTVQRS